MADCVCLNESEDIKLFHCDFKSAPQSHIEKCPFATIQRTEISRSSRYDIVNLLLSVYPSHCRDHHCQRCRLHINWTHCYACILQRRKIDDGNARWRYPHKQPTHIHYTLLCTRIQFGKAIVFARNKKSPFLICCQQTKAPLIYALIEQSYFIFHSPISTDVPTSIFICHAATAPDDPSSLWMWHCAGIPLSTIQVREPKWKEKPNGSARDYNGTALAHTNQVLLTIQIISFHFLCRSVLGMQVSFESRPCHDGSTFSVYVNRERTTPIPSRTSARLLLS